MRSWLTGAWVWRWFRARSRRVQLILGGSLAVVALILLVPTSPADAGEYSTRDTGRRVLADADDAW